MRPKSSPRHLLTATAMSLSAVLVLASCTGDDGSDSDAANNDDHLIPQEDIDRLNSTLTEANELAVELNYTASRLTRECMEDLGFTLHPEPLELAPDSMIRALPGTEVPHQEMLPDTDSAASQGAEVHEDWLYTQSDEYDNTETPTDPEWLALGMEGHDEYFNALHGFEREDTSELSDEELRDSFQDDSNDEIEGCKGQVIQQLYGDDVPLLEEVDAGDVKFDALPPFPGDITLEVGDIDFHTQELQEAQDDWNMCLEERGNPAVTQVSQLNQYLRSFYAIETPEEVAWYDTDGARPGYIAPPEGAPFEFEEAKEREIAFMTDLAECADDTEFRQARQDAWDQTVAAEVIEYEEEMYLWEDQVRAALGLAQEALAE